MDGSKTGGFRKARIHHNQFQAALDRTLHPFHRITDQKSSGRMGYQRIAAEQYGDIRIINMVTPCMPISHAARGNRLGRLIDRQRGEQGRCPQCLQELAMNSKCGAIVKACGATEQADGLRSEEHTSELQSLMRISYAVFGLKKK